MEWSARCAESGTAARRADGACRGSVGTPVSTASPPAETRGGAGTSRPPFPRCASCGNAGARSGCCVEIENRTVKLKDLKQQ